MVQPRNNEHAAPSGHVAISTVSLVEALMMPNLVFPAVFPLLSFHARCMSIPDQCAFERFINFLANRVKFCQVHKFTDKLSPAFIDFEKQCSITASCFDVSFKKLNRENYQLLITILQRITSRSLMSLQSMFDTFITFPFDFIAQSGCYFESFYAPCVNNNLPASPENHQWSQKCFEKFQNVSNQCLQSFPNATPIWLPLHAIVVAKIVSNFEKNTPTCITRIDSTNCENIQSIILCNAREVDALFKHCFIEHRIKLPGGNVITKLQLRNFLCGATFGNVNTALSSIKYPLEYQESISSAMETTRVFDDDGTLYTDYPNDYVCIDASQLPWLQFTAATVCGLIENDTSEYVVETTNAISTMYTKHWDIQSEMNDI